MSWKADQIYTKPNTELITYLQNLEGFTGELFLVNDLKGIQSAWARSFMLSDQPIENSHRKHSFPKDGLLVIKPPKTGKAIYEDEWGFIQSISSISIKLDLDLSDNQKKLMTFLESLYKKFNFPFLYYYCLMWGGMVEREFAIVFDEKKRIYTCDPDKRKDFELTDNGSVELEKTLLQTSLSHFGLDLPDWYFALHDGFDWERYRVEK